MNTNDLVAKWQRELTSFRGIKSTFIIEGDISDIYPNYREKDGQVELTEFCSLNRIITNIFDSDDTKDYYDFIFCDPLFGFSDPLNLNNTSENIRKLEKQLEDKNKQIKEQNGKEKREVHSNNEMVQNSEIIRTAITTATSTTADTEGEAEQKKSYAVIVNFASHYISSPENLSVDETTFYLNLLYASNNAIRGNRYINTLILIVQKFNDIPAWFYLNNPNVRTITIPNPDRKIREAYIDKYFKIFKQEDVPEIAKIKDKFVDLTDGMKILEINELRRLQDRIGVPVQEIGDIVSIYKYGFRENKWAGLRDKIEGNVKERIEKRVKGQDRAIEKIVRVIKRAVTGLSGMQHSSESKPRGILFLAGPSGTGKTEIVKTVAELLFEDEKALIRFDMSEYTAEHSDQKLFGAPPGYVGYDNGGQLTNAVKANPFSILLFDEIDKAHPLIMDKFLQILEDGRMTDGQGNTVYFSETLIFFTSNKGISEEIEDPITHRVTGRRYIVQPGEPFEVIQDKVEEAMRTSFRPEVINRIGENILVFDFLNEDISKAIAKSQIKKINDNIKKKNKIDIMVTEKAFDYYFDLAWQDKPRMYGGRGIGNVIEEYYLNPLAEYIFDNRCSDGDSIDVDVEGKNIIFRKKGD